MTTGRNAAVFLLLAVTKVIWAAQVEVIWKERLVLPGDNTTFLCQVKVPLQYCRIEIPGENPLNLNKGQRLPGMSYYGEGLELGQCGVTINRVEEKHNGNIKCNLGVINEPTESSGTMQLVVAKQPKMPELDLSRGTDSLRVYKAGETLEASCIVRDGRPVANISWFLDDEPIIDNGLKMPTVVELAKENLQSKLQNLTKNLQPTDNGKFLKCRAHHPAYPNGYSETKRQLDVKFPPQEVYGTIDRFGYQLGQLGLINVTIEANPKPKIEWTVAGQKLREGQADNSGRIVAEDVREVVKGHYIANLKIAAIKKEDTETDYILTAYNDQGQQDYRIKISTSPEPEGLDLGIGSIIGIVVAVLFVVLLISILIFARVTGRWCFGGRREPALAESSDTESVEVRTKDPRRNIPPIKLTSLFKKNKDKVTYESEPEKRVIETEDAPKEANQEQEEESVEKKVAEKPQQEHEPEEKTGLVYAELDLVRAEMKPVVKNDDEKTEYAEIVYTPADAAATKDTEESPKK